MSADIGVIGLAVMGENLVLNFERNGFTVAVNNRTLAKITEFVEGRAKDKKIIGCNDLKTFVGALKKPRKAMMMVKAGDVVDSYINQLVPLLEAGDIIIDGGNSNFEDTNRRYAALKAKGIHFAGCGISGGEEGALLGPSIMPGGAPEAWPILKPLFQAICAKVEGKSPCCDWVGVGGAGHYVKTVHNGIEYGDMQLVCEAYALMKQVLKATNEELHAIFDEWNKGELDSYLIEITRDILGKKDDDGPAGSYVVDNILDVAGQKGTGKWTAISALELGVPVTLIAEAVFARCLSAQKSMRVRASTILEGPATTDFKGDAKAFINDVRDALYLSKIVSYAQGFVQIRAASDEYKWDINYGGVALMWRGGCIIRSKFLGNITEAFGKNPALENLLLDPFFHSKVQSKQAAWRRICIAAVERGIPCPAMTAALTYYDGLRTARLSHNLLQAQRDYFGAHTYQRIDKDPKEFFHTNWTGRGGTTTSNTYTV